MDACAGSAAKSTRHGWIHRDKSPWNVWAFNYFWHHALLVTLIQSQSKAQSDASIRRDWSGAHRLLHAIWPKSSVVKGIWAGPTAQQIQSRVTVERQERTSIDGFGRARHQSYSGQKLHLCGRHEGQPTRMSQTSPVNPPPFPGEGALLLHSVILRLLRVGCAFGPATLLLGERKAAEMCTTHGRNYVL